MTTTIEPKEKTPSLGGKNEAGRDEDPKQILANMQSVDGRHRIIISYVGWIGEWKRYEMERVFKDPTENYTELFSIPTRGNPRIGATDLVNFYNQWKKLSNQ